MLIRLAGRHRTLAFTRGAVATLVALTAAAASAQTPASAPTGLPDSFQIDTGAFLIDADTRLRFQGDEVQFERDLQLDDTAGTFWVDGTWRVSRRHQVKLSYTRLSRESRGVTLQRDITWGGQVYSAGLTASATNDTDILTGYYRFALVRNDRFEIGPALGIGYLWLSAGIRASGSVSGPEAGTSVTLEHAARTGSITGDVGGYAIAWPHRRVALRADLLYIRVKPDESDASVTDWRLAADFYPFRNAGIGVQYKYYKYRYDRGILSSQLGGEIAYRGAQLYLSFLF